MNVPPSRLVRVRDNLDLRVLDLVAAQSVSGVDAPVFVLVHGLSSNALMWRGVGRHLADQGFRSVAIDLRGHGQSTKPDGPYDLQTVTDDLGLLLDHEQLSDVVLVGQSWGANVVVEFGARFPGRVRGIVPVDGGFIELSQVFPDWADCEREMAPPRLAGTPAVEIEGWLRRAHPDWTNDAIADMLGFVEVRADGTAAPWLSFENHLRVLRGLWDHHPSQRYELIADPVWWLVAEQPDGAIGWSARKHESLAVAQSSLKQCRVTWMLGDHDLHAQYPDRVADLLVAGVTEGFFR